MQYLYYFYLFVLLLGGRKTKWTKS